MQKKYCRTALGGVSGNISAAEFIYSIIFYVLTLENVKFA